MEENLQRSSLSSLNYSYHSLFYPVCIHDRLKFHFVPSSSMTYYLIFNIIKTPLPLQDHGGGGEGGGGKQDWV